MIQDSTGSSMNSALKERQKIEKERGKFKKFKRRGRRKENKGSK